MCSRDRDRVLQLLAGVHFQFRSDIHVRRALERLRVDDVGDDRLVLASEILVQQFDQLFSCDDRISHIGISFHRV